MVRRHGTVTAAARAMHLTPSAVSQQVRSLARELDVDLLRPAGRGVRLSPAADILLDHADRLYAGWEQAQADLEAHRLGDRGPLWVCGFPSALAALLPSAAARLRDGEPPLQLVAVQADPVESFDRLGAGDVDLAIVEAGTGSPASTDERFQQELLFDDPLQLIVPFDHRLASHDRIALAEAIDEDWVGGPADGSYHAIELLTCHRAGFTPRFVHQALDWTAYIAVVEAGLGVALLPRLAVPLTGNIRCLELTDDPAPARHILTSVRRGSQDRPTIRRLREALRLGAMPHLSGGRGRP